MENMHLAKISKQIEMLLVFFPVMVALVFSVSWLINSSRAWQAYQVELLLNSGYNVDQEIIMQTLQKAWHLDKTIIPGKHLYAPAMLASNLKEEWDVNLEFDSRIITDARESAHRVLAREPADANAWAQLAYFRYLTGGPSQDVLNALKMSLYFAPSRHNLIFWRLQMAVIHSDFWDEETAYLVKRQIIPAWRENPALLVEMAASFDFVREVKDVLSSYPDQLAELDTLMEKHEIQ